MVKEMLKEKAGYLLSNLLSQGGEYGEIFYEKVRTCRIQLEDNKIDKVQWGIDDNGKVLKDFDIKVAKVVRLTDGYILDKNKALIVGKIRRGNRYDINPNDGGFWGIIDLNSYNMEKSKIIDSGFWFDSINPTGKRSFLVWSENNIGEIILEGSFKWKLDLSSEMCPKIVSIKVS